MKPGKFHHLLFLVIALPAILAYLFYLDVGLFERGGDADTALTAKKLLEGGAFDAWYHPPFTYMLLAASFAIGGYSEFVARFGVLVFFVLGGFFTFRLGRLLHSADAGVLAAFLYMFSPVLVSGVFLYWINALFMVFLVASVYFMCEYSVARKDFFLLRGAFFAGLAILTKEVALLLFPVYFFVFRRDKRLRMLLLVMAFFAGVWLAGYELLNQNAHEQMLVRPVARFLSPYPPAEATTAVASLLDFASRMDPIVFLAGIAGGAWLFAGNPRRLLLPVLVSFAVLLLLSASQTRHFKYYLPAVPFLAVFASALFFEVSSAFPRALRLSAVVLAAFFLGFYAFSFFEKLGSISEGWDGSPRFALRDFVLNNTSPADSLVVVDSTNSDWLEFYTGRVAYSVPAGLPSVAQHSLVSNLSPAYLAVRVPPGSDGALFGDNCSRLDFLEGGRYGYAIYKCAWR